MEAAAEEFWRYVQPQWTRLHAVARRYVASEVDVPDLVQETLLRAWRSYSPTEERTYSRAWLFVIMRNAVVDWQRTARRRINLVPTPDSELTELAPADLTEPFCPLPSMDEGQFREFLDDQIVAALDELEPVFREVIVLSVAGGLGYKEIAEVLGCPAGTVMSRMARARRLLREKLAGYVKETGWSREKQR